MEDDRRFMMRALALAERGEGRVSPNPLVGAVVARNGKIIGEGWHGKFGGPHAEVMALEGIDARGATLYVTLEPCSHSGAGKKTPPCVPLVIKSGVKRVVVAAKDPNPKVNGMRQLRDAGINVDVGTLKEEAEKQNGPFFKLMKTGRAFVALKMAQSADGKIGRKGSRTRISGKKFDLLAQRMRNRYDAILVGINTVLEDDPRLTCRIRGGRNPARIVMDSLLRIPLGAKVLRNAGSERVIIATSKSHGFEKEQALKSRGATVLVCGREEASLSALVESLPSLEIYSLLIEGGAGVAKSALEEGLVDRLAVCVSPKRMGSEGTVASPITPAVLRRLKGRKEYKLGQDTVVEGRF